MALYFSNSFYNTKNNQNKIDEINVKIPAAASADNQLADKQYVSTQLSDHISTLTAAFNGSYTTYAELTAATGMNKNDYAVVLADEEHNGECWRYKYDGTAWKAEYRVNETALTTEQNNALNSGITADTVTKIASIVPENATADNKLATTADVTALSSQISTDASNKMDKNNPTGAGKFTMNGGTANGNYNMAIGRNAQTDGVDSVVLGGYNGKALRNSAVVIGGEDCEASGTNSVASGMATLANHDHQFVTGMYNATDPNTYHLFTIGNGSSTTARSNAAAITHDGDLYMKGTVYVNCDSNSKNGTSLSDLIQKSSSLKLSGTLTAGDNTLTFNNPSIKPDMLVNVYTSLYSVTPDVININDGSATLTFYNTLSENMQVVLRLETYTDNDAATTTSSSVAYEEG